MSLMNTSNSKELDYDFLSIGIEKGIATITLDNQPVNALSGRMMQELHQVLHQLAKDPS
jgi:enoyl-CoA hydratase/carnithine racemase